MEKILNIKNLSELSKESITPAISIYMPLEISGKSRSENRIRLDNLIKKTVKMLVDAGTEKEYAAQIMAPSMELIDNSFFWKQTAAAGLALFVTPPQVLRYFELPDRVEEAVRVNSGFYLDPLRDILGKNRDFFLLASSKNNLSFYRGAGGELEKISVRGLPESIEELLPDKTYEKKLESHGAAPRGKMTIMHGQGGKKDAQKALIERYFQTANNALNKFLAKKKEPLLFAGSNNLYAVFCATNTYKNLHQKWLRGNFEETPLPDLFKKASDVLKSTS